MLASAEFSLIVLFNLNLVCFRIGYAGHTHTCMYLMCVYVIFPTSSHSVNILKMIICV